MEAEALAAGAAVPRAVAAAVVEVVLAAAVAVEEAVDGEGDEGGLVSRITGW